MNYVHIREPKVSIVTTPDNNNFSKAVRKDLVDRGMTIRQLAAKIEYPRETVSRAIHGADFPLVRSKIVKHLKLKTFLPS